MANKKIEAGFERCVGCGKDFHISDPKYTNLPNGNPLCLACFMVVFNKHTSWGANRESRIVFEYKKVVIPHKLKWEVWKRDGFKCITCGSQDDLSIDHIHPECRGGGIEIQNLQTLCRSCNSRKCARG
jgi:5-methylcytosine-specific restriction endonuclease McrA